VVDAVPTVADAGDDNNGPTSMATGATSESTATTAAPRAVRARLVIVQSQEIEGREREVSLRPPGRRWTRHRQGAADLGAAGSPISTLVVPRSSVSLAGGAPSRTRYLPSRPLRYAGFAGIRLGYLAGRRVRRHPGKMASGAGHSHSKNLRNLVFPSERIGPRRTASG
jgi:hypothetical protein